MSSITRQGILFIVVLSLSLLISGGLFWNEMSQPQQEPTPTVEQQESYPPPSLKEVPVTEDHWVGKLIKLFDTLEGFLLALTPLLSPVIVYFVQRRQGKYLIRKQAEEIPT